ncbi:MAG: hypothetical protein LBJ73_00885 [Rickettsiales bacterium]|jgi:hypothetical protein|nr:hypothetical protein [Rickettsiales bacterium]
MSKTNKTKKEIIGQSEIELLGTPVDYITDAKRLFTHISQRSNDKLNRRSDFNIPASGKDYWPSILNGIEIMGLLKKSELEKRGILIERQKNAKKKKLMEDDLFPTQRWFELLEVLMIENRLKYLSKLNDTELQGANLTDYTIELESYKKRLDNGDLSPVDVWRNKPAPIDNEHRALTKTNKLLDRVNSYLHYNSNNYLNGINKVVIKKKMKSIGNSIVLAVGLKRKTPQL